MAPRGKARPMCSLRAAVSRRSQPSQVWSDAIRLISNPYRLVHRSAWVISFAVVVLMGQMVAQAGGGSDAPNFLGPPRLETARYGEQLFDGVPMVQVPAGCFDSGDPDAGNNSFGNIEAGPAKPCFAEGFWIDKYEVTNADFVRLTAQAHEVRIRHFILIDPA